MKVAERRRAKRPMEYQCAMLSIKIKASNGILWSCFPKKCLTFYPCWLWIKKKGPAPPVPPSPEPLTSCPASASPPSTRLILEILTWATVTLRRNKWNGSSYCQWMIRILEYEKASGSAKWQTGGGIWGTHDKPLETNSLQLDSEKRREKRGSKVKKTKKKYIDLSV